MQDNMLSLLNQKDPNSAPVYAHSVDEAFMSTIGNKPYNPNQKMLLQLISDNTQDLSPSEEMAIDSDQVDMPLEDMSTNVFETHLEEPQPEATEEPQWSDDFGEIITNYNHPDYLKTVAGKTIEVDGELREYDKNGYSYKVYYDDPDVEDAHYLTTTHNVFTGNPNAENYSDLQSYQQSQKKGSTDAFWWAMGVPMAGASVGWQALNALWSYGDDVYDWLFE
jgi:hypothetical protein